MDHSRWRKLINDVWWSGWVWVSECFFWYRPTQVVLDRGLLNGCVYVFVVKWCNEQHSFVQHKISRFLFRFHSEDMGSTTNQKLTSMALTLQTSSTLLIITAGLLKKFHCRHFINCRCRMTNYELDRWFVKVLSCDIILMMHDVPSCDIFHLGFIIFGCRTHYLASSVYC